MSIRVLFFGSTVAETGKRQIEIDLVDESKTREILDQLLADYPKLTGHHLLFAVNQEYATGNEIVHDGDELAIFTAVSGG